MLAAKFTGETFQDCATQYLEYAKTHPTTTFDVVASGFTKVGGKVEHFLHVEDLNEAT